MKIIPIVGKSNSGKTTFIRSLIPHLIKRGQVAVIKHLGDHEFVLERGKDTTVFFESRADISIGIDSHKTVIAIRKTNLDNILRFIKYCGISFVIIEGFKNRSFPKIVLGDLQIDSCIMRNPTVPQVMDALSLFEDY